MTTVAQPARRVVLADLPPAERERFFAFLVTNDVDFAEDPVSGGFIATIRVVPPRQDSATAAQRGLASPGKSPGNAASGNGGSRLAASQVSAGGAARSGIASPNASASFGYPAAPRLSPTAMAGLTPQQAAQKRHYVRFCEGLPAPPTQPQVKPMSRGLLLQFADAVFDARYEQDTSALRAEHALAGGQVQPKRLGACGQAFPDFVVDFATKRHGLRKLIGRHCWGLLGGLDVLRSQHPAVDLFGRFLEERYDGQDLLFFLSVRIAVQNVIAANAPAANRGAVSAKPTGPVQRRLDATLTPEQCKMVVCKVVDGKRPLRMAIVEKLDHALTQSASVSAKGPMALKIEDLIWITTAEYHASRGSPVVSPMGGSMFVGFEETLREPLSGLGQPDKSGLASPPRYELIPEAQEDGGPTSIDDFYNKFGHEPAELQDEDFVDELLGAQPPQEEFHSGVEEQAVDEENLRRQWYRKASLSMSEEGGLKAGDTPPPEEALLPPPDDVAIAEPDAAPEPVEAAQGSDDVVHFDDLEAVVKDLLSAAVSDLAIDVLAESMPAEDGAAPERAQLQGQLAESIYPVADAMMEALVGNDYSRWLDSLPGMEDRPEQQAYFDGLHGEFQELVLSEMSHGGIRHICQSVVATAELRSAARTHVPAAPQPSAPRASGAASGEAPAVPRASGAVAEEEFEKKPQDLGENTEAVASATTRQSVPAAATADSASGGHTPGGHSPAAAWLPSGPCQAAHPRTNTSLKSSVYDPRASAAAALASDVELAQEVLAQASSAWATNGNTGNTEIDAATLQSLLQRESLRDGGKDPSAVDGIIGAMADAGGEGGLSAGEAPEPGDGRNSFFDKIQAVADAPARASAGSAGGPGGGAPEDGAGAPPGAPGEQAPIPTPPELMDFGDESF